MITIAEIEHLAKLAKLEVSEAEKKMYSEQLSAIVSYFAQLEQVNTSAVPVTNHSTGLTTVTRTDEPRGMFDAEKVLAAAPEVDRQHIKVNAVFED
jgi:aspartyl-tRNA(Asn)/glutamyl-tRNA(Gln) amidotransferase subunit C